MNTHNRFEGGWSAIKRDTTNIFRDIPVRIVSSEALFQGTKEIAIDHNGSRYRLKITRQGKLILNK